MTVTDTELKHLDWFQGFSEDTYFKIRQNFSSSFKLNICFHSRGHAICKLVVCLLVILFHFFSS